MSLLERIFWLLILYFLKFNINNIDEAFIGRYDLLQLSFAIEIDLEPKLKWEGFHGESHDIEKSWIVEILLFIEKNSQVFFCDILDSIWFDLEIKFIEWTEFNCCIFLMKILRL